MKKNSISESRFFNPRILLASILCSIGLFLALSFALRVSGVALAQGNGFSPTSLQRGPGMVPEKATFATPRTMATQNNRSTAPNLATANSWMAAAPYPTAIERYAFAQVGEDMYVISGRTSGGTLVNTVRRYNATTNVWTSLANIPVGLEAPAAAFFDGKIYVAGGNSDVGPTNNFQIYDIATNVWSAGPNLPVVTWGAAAGAFNGNVCVAGGNNLPTTTLSIYNIATNTWGAAGPAAPSPYLLGGFTQIGRFLYMIGSFGATAADNTTVSMRLDLSTNTWSTGPIWTPARADFALAAVDSRLFAIGGDTQGGTFFNPSVLVDELETNTWPGGAWAPSPENLPSARQANQAGFFSTGRVGGEIWSTGGFASFGPPNVVLNENLFRALGPPPGPENNIGSAGSTIISAGPNGVLDPGEVVTVALGVANTGGPGVVCTTGGLTGTLQASGGVTLPPGPVNYGPICSGSTAVFRNFTFTVDPALPCGGTVTASLVMMDGVTNYGTLTFTFTTGTQVAFFSEKLDGVSSPALPAGWVATQGLNAGGSPFWMTSNSGAPAPPANSPPNSAFTIDPGAVLDNRLDTPIFMYTAGSKLTFKHNYDLEQNSATVAYDAGVLEISINGGAFADIITAGGSFVSGGYDHTGINLSFGNPLLPSRPNWSGVSGGFITTMVNLPAAGVGLPVKVRWRMGSDDAVAQNGWRVDDISVETAAFCAPTLLVTTATDHDDGVCDGADCTLREAINAANARVASIIEFGSGVAGTIQLASALPSLTSNIMLQGPGANVLTVRRNTGGNYRIFNIAPAGVIVAISGLTIANGNAPGANGGGVSNSGTLIITNSIISGNSSGGGGSGGGGGIYNTGALTVTTSTISGNQSSGYGGGIYNTGRLNLTNSTISGNSVSGGIFYGGGIFTDVGLVSITNSTISSNTSQYRGGGIVIFSGTVTVRNAIIAQNSAGNGEPDVSGALTSQNFNFIGNSAGATITPPQVSDQIGPAGSPINPMLGPLQDNGGPTFTLALLSGSPAIDKGHSSGSATDQRGSARPVGMANTSGGDGSDIGAFEVQVPSAVNLVGFTATARDSGVLLNWQTGFEVNNLGFRIFRDSLGARTPVNQELIAGSALVAGSTALTAGRSYSWLDKGIADCGSRLSDCFNARYWLEDLDLNGTSTWHGPFYVKLDGDKPAAHSQAALLSSIGQLDGDSTHVVMNVAELVRANQPVSSPVSLQQANLASSRAVKIGVKKSGWYRVTQSELVAAGFDEKADPRMLRLLADGKELPILVAGEDDGVFDANDAVEFFGLGLNTPSTDTRVYWLEAGLQRGLRIADGAVTKGYPSGESFAYTVERRDRTIYFSALRNGDEENFFGSVVTVNPIDQKLTLNHISQSAREPAVIDVSFQGVTRLTHQVSISVNGYPLGRVLFNGQSNGRQKIEVSQALLRERDNVITLQSVNGPSDVSLVDAIRVTYQHRYQAENDSLSWTARSGETATIGGFSTKDVQVLDVSDERDVKRLAVSVDQTREGYSATFTVPSGTVEGERKLLALTGTKAHRASSIKLNEPSSWRDANNAADLVIITARRFVSALEPLRKAREAEGYKVAVIDVEDLYDEFSFGNKSAYSVRDFLSLAQSNWKLRPRFVMFAGDASYDPKNYLGFGENDLVPTKLLDTAYMETASDDWFSDFDGDGVADMATGRLPVRSFEEAARAIAKVIRYQQAEQARSALLVSDQNDGFDFEQASAQLRPLIPRSIRIEELRRGELDPRTAKARLLDAIARGEKLINYAGHGSMNQWRGSLFSSEDARGLTNGDRLPVFVMMTCLNGYFQDAGGESLAESLMNAEQGGAIAVWASTGLTVPQDQAVMNQALYALMFNQSGKGLSLGEATAKAKANVRDIDTRRTWILLGDPTIRLR